MITIAIWKRGWASYILRMMIVNLRLKRQEHIWQPIDSWIIQKHFCSKKLGGGKIVATVSIGVYKANPNVGGDFRIGVTKEAQGKGYGRLCILFAFSQLAAMGLKYGESAISFKRKESLNLHYALGFKPQPNLKYVANKTADKKIKNLNFILKYRLKKSYRDYIKKERKHFK